MRGAKSFWGGCSRFLAPLLAALCLAACGVDTRRADLVFINGAEPESLDPARITGQPEGRIAGALFEGLAAFDEFGVAGPGVAERWEVLDEGRRYLFHLRPDAKWSNGDPVTAEDFVRSWRRTLEPATAADYAYMLYPIAGAREFNEGLETDFSNVGVKALSPLLLEVRLVNPTPYFPDLCAFVTYAPTHAATVGRYGDGWAKPGRLVGNGAYVLESWRLNDRVRLRKNPFYWDRENVRMETIDILPISAATTAFNHYHSGVADLMLDKGLAPVQLLDELKKRPDFHSAPFLATYFLRFNCSRPPFNDARARKALALALDRALITSKITRAGEVPAGSFVPPGTANHLPVTGLGLDVAEARRLLAEAGYPDGRGFPLVTYLYNSSELNDFIAVEIREMIRRALGVELTLRKQEWKVYLNSLNALDYDVARSSWVGDYNDPNTFLDLFVTGGGNNRTGWAHPHYDALIHAAAAESDTGRRSRIFQEAERILVEQECPITPLYYFVGIQMYDRERLGGVEANLLDEHPLRRMFWRQGSAVR